jgi:soluble epoxide hydrolase/lipid-phosphate phosphatase
VFIRPTRIFPSHHFTAVMTAIQMPRKELNVDDKVTYSYVHIEAKTSLPTFLLLHGFPSSAYDWRHQIAHLRQAGYGIIAPDLLGYGRTDSPEAIEDYKFSKMSVHISKILEHHKIRQVIGVAHDW